MSAVKGVNFVLKGTNAAGPAMRQFQGQLQGVQRQVKVMAPLQASWNRGLNENRRAVQQFGFQLGDFATQIAGGQSAMLAFVQQGGQMLQFFGVWGAVSAAALAVFGSLYIAITRSGVALSEITPILGVLQHELAFFASIFKTAFDVVIWVINLVLNNLDVLATMGLIYLMKLGMGAVVASNSFRALIFTLGVLGPVQGALAAGTWALTAAFTALRAILLTFLPLALLAAVAWLIVKFIELIQLAGGFGNAMKLLFDIVRAVFGGMAIAGTAAFQLIQAGVYSIVAAFAKVFEWVATAWENVVNTMIDGWNYAMDAIGAESFKGARYVSEALTGATAIVNDFETRAVNAANESASNFKKAANGIATAWGNLTSVFDKSAPINVRDWFGGGEEALPSGKGKGSKGSDAALEKLKSDADEIKKIFDDISKSIQDSLMSGFKAVIKGTKSLKDYALDVLDTILDKIIELLMQPVFAAIANTITGGILKTFGLPSFDGGGFTGRGSRTGGLDGKGGFMAMLHPNESVIDHTKGGGSTGGSRDVHVYIHEGDMFAARVDARARDVALTTVRAGLSQYDRRVFARSFERVENDPMVR